MKIDEQKTYDAIRVRYGSVQSAIEAFGVSKPAFYFAVKGKRGGKTHPAPKSEAVLARLRSEKLLVEVDDVDPSVSHGSTVAA